jgi:hypothetical protein
MDQPEDTLPTPPADDTPEQVTPPAVETPGTEVQDTMFDRLHTDPLHPTMQQPEPPPMSDQPPTLPITSLNPAELFYSVTQGLEGDETWYPNAEDVLESTTSYSKPLRALERMRRMNRTEGSFRRSGPGSGISGSDGSGGSRRGGRGRARRGRQAGIGTMDIFAVLAQVNDQLSSAPNLEAFLKVVVGVIKDLTQFHRVLVYQFDESWNGQVVAELVDWRQTHDLYKGLHFPAADIPAQARELYKISA